MNRRAVLQRLQRCAQRRLLSSAAESTRLPAAPAPHRARSALLAAAAVAGGSLLLLELNAGGSHVSEVPSAASAVTALSRAALEELRCGVRREVDGQPRLTSLRAVSVVAARLLADAATSRDAERREALARAGGGSVSDWLLRTAAWEGGEEGSSEGGASAEQHARRAVAALLSDAHTSPSLLRRPGVWTALLDALPAEEAGRSTRLGEALQLRLASGCQGASPPQPADVQRAAREGAGAGERAVVARAMLAAWAGESGGWAEAVASSAEAVHTLLLSLRAPQPPLTGREDAHGWAESAVAADALRCVSLAEPSSVPEEALTQLLALLSRALAVPSLTLAAQPSGSGRATAAAVAALAALVDCRLPGATEAAQELLPYLLPAAGAASPSSSPLPLAACALLSALERNGGLDAASLVDGWSTLLLRWSTTEAGNGSASPLAAAATAALSSLVASGAAPSYWKGALAQLWLSHLLTFLVQVHGGGWAPHCVQDEAAQTATAAAAALRACALAEAAAAAAAVADAVGAIAATPQGSPAVTTRAGKAKAVAANAAYAAASAASAAAAAAAAAASAASSKLTRRRAATAPDAAAAAAPPPVSTLPPKEEAFASALRALALLLSSEPRLAEAAVAGGALQLLNSCVCGERTDGQASPSQPLPLQQHTARLLALLALLPQGAASVMEQPASGWLQEVLRQQGDCLGGVPGAPPPAHASASQRKLASYARAAQLNAAYTTSAGGQPSASSSSAAASPGMIRLEDGVFLFQPCAASASGEGAVADVVFVHGLRGGPFETWRRGPDSQPGPGTQVGKPGTRRRPMGEFECWPADWLAPDLAAEGVASSDAPPPVRLLSLSYRSRYSDWEGPTLGLQTLADSLLEKLRAAGVGERPLVLVGHSLGGVLIKLMLQRAEEEPDRHGPLAAQLRLAVFYSCPHFGSNLAGYGSWRLVRPSGAVAGLRPGARDRLEVLNEGLRRLHQREGSGAVRVLSFMEGKPTQLAELPLGRGIATQVVSAESADPGFGEVVVLEDKDHIHACKPLSRQDVPYVRTLGRIREVLADVLGSS